jgi:2-iminobutanoate/2-iminopropanoate deaminase
MDDFTAVNAIYAQFFKTDPPARSAFAVKQLPKGAKVEIEAIAAYPYPSL